MTTSESHRNHRIGAFGAATASVLMVGFASGANAQIFCPTGANGQLGITLQGGFCTNGNTGALSTAALSSQSLSEVTETTTQQSTTSTLRALEKRRNEAAGSPRSRRSLRQKGRRVRRYRRLRSLQPSGNRPSNGRRGSNRQSDPPRKRQASNVRPNRPGEKRRSIRRRRRFMNRFVTRCGDRDSAITSGEAGLAQPSLRRQSFHWTRVRYAEREFLRSTSTTATVCPDLLSRMFEVGETFFGAGGRAGIRYQW
jgi:hypothetical protein